MSSRFRRSFSAFVCLLAIVLVGPASSLVVPPTWADEPTTGSPIKTLLLTGGPIHNAQAIGDIVQDVLEKSGRFDLTRVHEDLDALLPERIAPYKLVVFFWTDRW